MNQFNQTYIIDFSEVKHYLEMHYVIKKALDFPDYYGCNWAAFWDCLTDMYGEPIHIEIRGLDVIVRKFGDAASKLVEILKRFKHNYYDKYSSEILIEIVSGDTKVELK